MFVTIFINITLFLKIKNFLNNFEVGFMPEEYQNDKVLFRTMIKFPICINACFLLPMVYEYYYLSKNPSNFAVNIIGTLGKTLIGFVFSLCFF